MSAFLDTSIIVRYLTGDPPELAEQAAQIVDGEVSLEVTDVVLAETAYVLTSVYRVPRANQRSWSANLTQWEKTDLGRGEDDIPGPREGEVYQAETLALQRGGSR